MAVSRKPLVLKEGFVSGMPAGDSIALEYGGTGSSTAVGARENLGVKGVLKDNIKIYVNGGSGGSDSNDGLVYYRPLATIQRAIDLVAQMDVVSLTGEVTIEVRPGSYQAIQLKRYSGAGRLPVKISAVAVGGSIKIFAKNGNCVTGYDCGKWVIDGIEFITSENNSLGELIKLEGNSHVKTSNAVFDVTGFTNYVLASVSKDAKFEMTSPTFNGESDYPFKATKGGVIYLFGYPKGAFKAKKSFFYADEVSFIDCNIYRIDGTFEGPCYTLLRGSSFINYPTLYMSGILLGDSEGYSDSTSMGYNPSLRSSEKRVYEIHVDGKSNNRGEGETQLKPVTTMERALEILKRINTANYDEVQIFIYSSSEFPAYPFFNIPDNYDIPIVFIGRLYSVSLYNDFEKDPTNPIPSIGRNNKVRFQNIIFTRKDTALITDKRTTFAHCPEGSHVILTGSSTLFDDLYCGFTMSGAILSIPERLRMGLYVDTMFSLNNGSKVVAERATFIKNPTFDINKPNNPIFTLKNNSSGYFSENVKPQDSVFGQTPGLRIEGNSYVNGTLQCPGNPTPITNTGGGFSTGA